MDSVTLAKLEFGQVREILARFCRSSLGEGLARRVRPGHEVNQIRAWLAETTEMVDTLIASGLPPFGGIVDISAALGRATPGGGATGDDFAQIAETLSGCGGVKRWAATLTETAPRLAAIGERLGEFEPEIEAIRLVVDERGEVRDTASRRLASIRGEIDGCHRQIRQVVQGFVRRSDVAQHLQSTNVQMHGDRFVLAVKADHRGRLPGVVHRSSQSGATLFIEPEECVQLNNHMVHLQEKQQDEITRLLGELAIRIHRRDEVIRASLRTLSRIDLIAAKAQYAYQFGMTCPQIGPSLPIQFHGGRHPLLVEQAHQQDVAGEPADQRQEVVPIDVRLGSDFNLLIITGSNTGGKTVTLKTVGLLVLMAHSGLHLPTQRGATIRLLTDVLLDVGDEQSLQQSLSTFGGHLKRIKHILGRADRRSLVLLDELGSGTDPEEGGAFGQAILDELRRVECLGMVTTHLGVLKAYAYNHDGVDNASVEFDTETLRPTYKLLIGQPGESHAIVVAEHYGLPRRLISGAKRHLPQTGRQLRQAIRATAESRKASEAARTEAHTAKIEADKHTEQYRAKLATLNQFSDRFSDWLASLPALRPGDDVFVRRFNTTGRLHRLQLSKQTAVVDVEGVQVEVPLQDLMPDLADEGAALQVTSLRRQIIEQHRQAEASREEAEKLTREARRQLAEVGKRQQYVEAWLEAVGALEVGSEVTFKRKPGRGYVTALDLAAGKATVEIDVDGEPTGVTMRLQELFPEYGAFGKAAAKAGKGAAKSKTGAGDGKPNRPIPRRKSNSKRAKSNRRILLAMEPGKEVYVVPFRKRARLVRIDEAKGVATVASGAFEMQVPMADLEPVGGQKGKDGRGEPKSRS